MSTIIKVFKKHIKGTGKKKQIKKLTIYVCNFSNVVMNEFKFSTNRVHLSTKSLKHMYDKRVAQEFDFILNNLPKIIKKPDKVYKNIKGKRGDYCFLKKFAKDTYFCIIENSDDVNPNDGKIGMNYVVSVYKLSEDKEKRKRYLSGYKLLWSWKGDKPSS